MPSEKPEIAGVDFHLSLLQGMNFLSLHQIYFNVIYVG